MFFNSQTSEFAEIGKTEMLANIKCFAEHIAGETLTVSQCFPSFMFCKTLNIGQSFIFTHVRK